MTVEVVDRHREPSQRELALFGLVPAVVLGVIGAVLGRMVGWHVAGVLWAAGVVFAAVYYTVPGTRWVLYRAWMTASFPLAWTVSHALLGAVYYLVLSPLGLARRLTGRDPMTRGFDTRASSYWTRRRPGSDLQRYFRQY